MKKKCINCGEREQYLDELCELCYDDLWRYCEMHKEDEDELDFLNNIFNTKE
jgi:hypothetical protein